jgi:hypothetical protein
MGNQCEGKKQSICGAACLVLALLVVGATLTGCSTGWKTTIPAPDGTVLTADRAVLQGLEEWKEAEETKGVPVEALLWQAGYSLVDRLTAVEGDGTRHEYEWAEVMDGAEWLDDGSLSIGGESYRASSLEVSVPAVREQIEASITDVAPTAAAALGLPAPAEATGKILEAGAASHVAIILVDGLGYLRFQQARDAGLAPALSGLGEPLMALTTFPPITSVSMASLLTGAPPQVHGVDVRGERKTEAETLLDVVSAAGRRAVAVEGESLPFNLPGAAIQLSGDRDGNGSTDDNVLANALAAIEAGMPDLLFVHFHGIDDAGHTYGPGTPEESAVVQGVDAAVGMLIEAIPSGTMILIAADHGMHLVQEEGRAGNHGHLIGEDMLIPVWVVEK